MKNSFIVSIFIVSTFHYRFSSISRTTATARFTINSLLQFLQEHFYGSIDSRVVTHYPIMGQGRAAHAQPAFFLAGLLFLSAQLRECERGTMMSMQSSDVVECGTSAWKTSGNVSSADTSTWSTYLPGRIARFRRK